MNGIHHVTAISSDPAATLRFYGDTLGLRLVKQTVNFDDPGTFHLYFGDRTGNPGSILTFFPFPGGMRGRIGTGQVAVTSFAIPVESVGWWIERLGARGALVEAPVGRFDERVVALRDPDGMLLELVGSPRYAEFDGWAQSGIPAMHAIRGIHGATLWTDGPATGTEEVLTGLLGLQLENEQGGTRRFRADSPLGSVIDLRRADGFWRGAGGVGTVHHVAFRAANETRQLALRAGVEEAGLQITPVVDRQYFKSVYFREPGGVLFEVATDAPGFLWDEPEPALGSSLKLPSWLESQREEIVRALPSLDAGSVEVTS